MSLPHYAVIRLGWYNQLQKILFAQPHNLGDLADLNEEQCQGIWDNYVSHISHGARDEFNETS